MFKLHMNYTFISLSIADCGKDPEGRQEFSQVAGTKSSVLHVCNSTTKKQCWTEGRSSTAVAKDFRPTATAVGKISI